ncbi:MAG TPA: sigma 54-interacting transcriptional regulator [Bacteroidales bacterium]|nr:sigma 54-interacting transcriptional regulator [Bacteroidales bacterium]
MVHKVLMIEDKTDFINSTRELLSHFCHRGDTVTLLSGTSENAAKQLLDEHPDLVIAIIDLSLEHNDSGIKIIDYIRKNKKNSDLRIIVLTGGQAGDEFSERKLIEDKTINDYILKTTSGYKDRLFTSISTQIDNYLLIKGKNHELKSIKKDLEETRNHLESYHKKLRDEILYKMRYSKSIKELIKKVENASLYDVTVLLQGETGVGKDLIANYLHKYSNRSGKPFLRVPCSCISELTAESELFGHKKGSFTDAKEDKIGYFEYLNGGTLFLDEIQTLKPEIQAKLLIVMEQKVVIRKGSNNEIPVNTRLIMAGSEKINDLVQSAGFLNAFKGRIDEIIWIPPLRERKEDIPHLATRIVNEANIEYNKNTAISMKAIEKLMCYDWPLNVRQLIKTIKSAVRNSETGTILPDDLFFEESEALTFPNNDDYSLRSAENLCCKNAILRALEKAKYNNEDAIKLLDINRMTYYKYKRILGI